MQKLTDSHLAVILDQVIRYAPSVDLSLELVNNRFRTLVQRIRDGRTDVICYGETYLSDQQHKVPCSTRVLMWENCGRRLADFDSGQREEHEFSSVKHLVIRPPTPIELAVYATKRSLKEHSKPASSTSISSNLAGSATPFGLDESQSIVSLIQSCKKVENIEFSSYCGMSNEVWQAMISAPDIQTLSLRSPCSPIAHLDTSTSTWPRYTPFFLAPHIKGDDSPTRQAEDAGSSRPEYDNSAIEDRMLGIGLRKLVVENLSQIGTRNLANHLDHLAGLINLPSLSILIVDTVFFDSELCTGIAAIGSCGVLCRLIIGTQGTKLYSSGIKEVVENCVGLKSLVFREVEGRLGRTLWKDIETYPSSLKEFEVQILEIGPHHSWAVDHLQSLSSLPMKQLETFKITRRIPLQAHLSILPIPPIAGKPFVLPEIHPLCDTQSMPDELFQVIIAEGKIIKRLDLDWWRIDEESLGKLIKGMAGIEELSVRVDFPFSRLITVACLPSTAKLVCFAVSAASAGGDCWELDTAKVKGRTNKTALLNKLASKPEISDSILASLPEELSSFLCQPDDSLPTGKDVKKFSRKLYRLKKLEWTGRDGKGCWTLSKARKDEECLPEKRLGLTSVDFEHCAVRLENAWNEVRLGRILFDYVEQDVAISDLPPPESSPRSTFSSTTLDNHLLTPSKSVSTSNSYDLLMPSPRLHDGFRYTGDIALKNDGLDFDPKVEDESEALGLTGVLSNTSSKRVKPRHVSGPRDERSLPPDRTDESPPLSLKLSSKPAFKPEASLVEREPQVADVSKRRGRRGGVSRVQQRPASSIAHESRPLRSDTVLEGWMTVPVRKPKDTTPRSRRR